MTPQDPLTWWKNNQPWAMILLGLLVIAVLYTQGGAWGGIGTIGLVGLLLVVLYAYGRKKGTPA